MIKLEIDKNMLNKNLLNFLEKNCNKKLNIFFQLEHNLVLEGGRTMKKNEVFDGKVNYIYNSNKKYKVRIVNFNNYKNFDIIFEYNIPNIKNIEFSNIKNKEEILNKIIYLPPLIFDFLNIETKREINLLTTIININEPRRKVILDKLKDYPHQNINNCFNKNDLEKLLDNTKILINIHQTEHHHTIEEFRILPALQRKVVVISENVPLKEYLPYKDFIVWSDYNNIMEKINEVLNNYDMYYNKFFNDNKLEKIMKKIEKESFKKII